MGQILVVDDDVDLCHLMVRLFKRFGHQADCENNGPAALAHLETKQPHVILLDVMMPDMTGIDVLRELRANAATAGIPVVMFSALSDPETKKTALSAGANDYFVKASVDFAQMMQRLAKFLPEQ